MLKLLPEEAKAKVVRAYSERRLIVLLLSLIVILLIGMAGLFPAYVLSKAKKAEVTERLKTAGDLSADPENVELRGWLAQTNKKLDLLNPKADTQYATYFIGRAIGLRPVGIQFTVIDWNEVEGERSLGISGIAASRQVLLDFERALNASGEFSQTTVPVSNLAKDREIPFQVDLVPQTKP